MRSLLVSLFATLAMAVLATAQITIPDFGSTYNSTYTRGFWFQAPIGFTIEGLRVPNEGAQPYQAVEVIDLGSGPPPNWPTTTTGTQLFFSNTAAAGTIIPCSIPVTPGACIGILGACTPTITSTTTACSYAATSGPFATNVLGVPLTIFRLGTQSSIANNGGHQPCFQEVTGPLGRVEVFVAGAGLSMPAFGSTFTSSQTRGYCFQAPTTFTIHGLRVPNEANQAYQVVEVIDYGTAPPPTYPSVGAGTQRFYSNSAIAGTVVPCSVTIAQGSYVGILGACTATVGNANSYNSYSAASSPIASTLLGFPVTLTRFGTQSGIASNGGNQPCFQMAAGSIGRVDMFAAASMPQPAFGSTFTNSLTRGYWFRAPVDLRIEGVSVPNEASQPYQVVEILDFGSAPPPNTPGTAVGTQLLYDNSAPGGSIVPCSIPITAGTYIGVLGACTPTIGDPMSYNSYAQSTGPMNTTILGAPATLTRLGTQSGIASNGGHQPCFSEPGATISRVNLLISQRNHEAMWQAYGAGCINRPTASFYELLPLNGFDLSNTCIRLTPSAYGYDVSRIAPVWWNPVGPNLGLGDDVVSGALPLGFTLNYPGGSTAHVYASSNGFVWAQPGGAHGCCDADPVAFVQGAARWSMLWNDLDPSIGGTVVFDQDPVHGAAYLTFNAVPEWSGTPGISTFQFAFFANGVVEYRWRNCAVVTHHPLVGWTPGATGNPGTMDISASLPFLTQPDLTPITFAASARPVLGHDIQLTTGNLPVSCLFGATLLGLTELSPGLDLTSIGMAGCYQHLVIDATHLWFPSGPTASTPFHVPATTAYAGIQVRCQSAALVPGANPLGVVSSNGVRLTLDIY